MAAIVWGDVEDFAAELSVVDSGAQTVILAEVNGNGIDVAVFGGETATKTKLARIYLAAHMGKLTLVGSSGASGPVTMESAGGISRQYALVSALSADYGLTVYGQAFSALARTTTARFLLV